MTSRKDTERLAATLIKAELIDELQLRSAMARLGNWGGRLPKVLAELGMADEEEMMIAIGKPLGLTVTHLGAVLKDSQALAKLEVAFCEEHCVFPVTLRDRLLSVAVVDPLELDLVDAVKSKAGGRVQILLASETEIRHAIMRHYRNQEPKMVSNRARKAVTRELPTNEEEKFVVDMSSPPKPRKDGEPEPKGPTLSPTDLARLEAARVNQSKTATILRAVGELLVEKGYMPGKRR